MLKHSFCHIPGVSPRIETSLWKEGVHTWEQFTHADNLRLTRNSHAGCCRYLELSHENLERRNPRFFYDALPDREQWRLFSAFRAETAYLDIETTGLSPDWNDITTIALYDGQRVKAYVNGINLRDFPGDITSYRQIVTFNGKCFDIPFLRRKFRMPLKQAHLDLRYILRSLGYTGGLKRCERMLGLERHGVEDVDGFMAVLLWEDYRRGNGKALETLLAYNMTDAVNLEMLMVLAFNQMLARTPFTPDLELPLPVIPLIPHSPDPGTIRRIQNSAFRPFSG